MRLPGKCHAGLDAALLIGAFALAAATTAFAAKLDALPPAMIGTWGFVKDACANGNDDGRMVIAARSVTFSVSYLELSDLDQAAPGVVTAHAKAHEEGETETSEFPVVLTLTPAGSLDVRVGTDTTHAYVRCSL